MKKWMSVLFVLGALCCSLLFSSLQEDQAHLIFPDPGEEICLATAKGTSDRLLVAEKLARDNPWAKLVLEQLDFPYHRSMIKLSQCARNLAFVFFLCQVDCKSRREKGS